MYDYDDYEYDRDPGPDLCDITFNCQNGHKQESKGEASDSCTWDCVPRKQVPKCPPWESFSEPGSGSALRCATFDRCWDCDGKIKDGDGFCKHCGVRQNPRNLPCPRCKRKNTLTPADKQLGYICDRCADTAERGGEY